MNTKLKPCPFCGSDNLYWGHESINRFHVSCLDCKGSGPIIDTPDEWPDECKAILDWKKALEELDNMLLKEAMCGWNKREKQEL